MKKKKTVLIIDDDPDFVDAITDLLESSGYGTKNAVNGKEGVKMAAAILPDLILLDVMMTERTEGFFTLQEIRRHRTLEHIPVVVLSSIYTEEPMFRVNPDAGWLPAEQFLAKPVDPSRILEVLGRLIGDEGSGASPGEERERKRR